jgi:hypothetical protein
MNGSIRPVSETLVRNTNPPALAGGCSVRERRMSM